MLAYHDREWGVPVHDDRLLFEHLVLDGFQAGLSWAVVLNKREAFRKAFGGFDAEKVARYSSRSVERLLRDPGIIRNRQKVEAAIKNAKAFLAVQEDVGSFDAFLWQFVDGTPKQNRWRTLKQIPAHTRQSDEMSAALKSRGFSFVGSTICYAFMQAAGLVNDHVVTCFRWSEVAAMADGSRPGEAAENSTNGKEAVTSAQSGKER
jgi:DNA-3-methyladenine glycosylase I